MKYKYIVALKVWHDFDGSPLEKYSGKKYEQVYIYGFKTEWDREDFIYDISKSVGAEYYDYLYSEG